MNFTAPPSALVPGPLVPSSLGPYFGIAKIGGRAVPCACFCVSISLTSIAGATALTGTVPDSAPHYPLKTSLLSPVA